MARLQRGSGNRSAQAVPRSTGFPFRRARNGTVARICHVIPRQRVVDRMRMVFFKNSFGHNSRTCRKSHNLNENSKGRRPSATKRLVAQLYKPACTRAGSAVLVPFKSFALVVSPGTRAAALTGEAADGSITQMFVCRTHVGRLETQTVMDYSQPETQALVDMCCFSLPGLVQLVHGCGCGSGSWRWCFSFALCHDISDRDTFTA